MPASSPLNKIHWLLASWGCLWLGLLLAPAHSAESFQMPAWLAGQKDLLPPVPMETVQEMRSIREGLNSPPELGPTPESYYKAVQRIVELGDQASLGMIYLYVEDVPRQLWNKNAARRRPANIIRNVFLDDTVTTKWVLPLLRYRLSWIESSLRSGKLDQSGAFPEEIEAIEGFMDIRGDPADLKQVHDLRLEISESDTQYAKCMGWVPTGEDIGGDVSRRKSRQRHRMPYHLSFLPTLEEWERELKKKGAKEPDLAGLLSVKSPTWWELQLWTSGVVRASWLCPVVTVLIVAVGGLLRRQAKRRK